MTEGEKVVKLERLVEWIAGEALDRAVAETRCADGLPTLSIMQDGDTPSVDRREFRCAVREVLRDRVDELEKVLEAGR